MNFAQPAFLFAAVLVVPVLLAARRSRAPLAKRQLWSVAALQTLAVLAAVVALAKPWRLGAGQEHRVVVVAGEPTPNWRSEIEALRQTAPQRDPFVVVRAGAAPVVGLPGATAVPAAAGTPDLTAALRVALGTVPVGAAGSVHVWTDGRHDGAALVAVAQELAERGLGVVVHEQVAARPAVALLAVEHPPQVAPGEAFRLFAHVRADRSRAVRLEVFTGERQVGAAECALVAGEQWCRVDVVVPGQGPVELAVRLVGDDLAADAVAERSAVLVSSPLRVLHLAADASRRDALAASLRQHGIDTYAPADPGQPLVDDASFWSCRAVLVDDLPAAAWSANHGLVRAAVQGGRGLVLAGTYHNLGPGGYAGSQLAELLPVRMPQREERRDPSVSLVLIVDTSGSMGGGRLELAKEVARLAIQKLQPHDKVGLIEFHGSKRWAAPLQPATNTIEITRALNRLQVGGGTIVYDALEESYFALLNAQTRFQHVLVLTDGGVESGPFETLVRRMATAGQTVSSVLLGPQASSPFLINLAQWGRGRFYACPDKFQLPDLQFREPQSALLPAVQERRVPLVRSEEAEATAAFAGDQLAASGGIVEASVRDGAEVLLRGAGGEPYLVGWDQGAGRLLVLAGQAIGPQSGELHDDPAYGAFLADLLRSAAAGTAADGLAQDARLELRTQERGVRVRVVGDAAATQRLVARSGEQRCELAPIGTVAEGFLPFDAAGPGVVEVTAGDQLLVAGAAAPPLPRALRTADAGPGLAALRALGAARQGDRQAEWLVAPFAAAALALFFAALLLRRVPWERRAAAAANRPAGAGGGAVTALALSALLGAASPLAAQDPIPLPPSDATAVRAAIDAELRRTGDLEALQTAWRDAPALHRFWLARLRGDLDAAQQICAEPDLLASHRDVRVQILDVLGRPAEALAALGEPGQGATPTERGQSWLRAAGLRVASGDRAGAAQALQNAVAAAGQREFAQQAGVLAAGFGFLDLALGWHEVGEAVHRDNFQAALRRGSWRLRLGQPALAAREYEVAFARAPLHRDRTFALAMLAAAHRAAGTLATLADGWLQRVDGGGAPLHDAELVALADVLRELGRARDGLQMLGRLPAERRANLGDLALTLAVEAGDPEAAIAQLQADLARDPADVEARASLAVLLADLQRDAAAAAVLREGIAGARPRALRRLGDAAIELGQDDIVAAIAAALGGGSGDDGSSAVDGALFEAAYLRRQNREPDAVRRLLGARAAARSAQDRLRLAEQLESLGQLGEATELYKAIWAESRTEDIGMRLGWLLGESKHAADREQAQQIFRQVWTSAGSAARRVQAEERVLDLAAREGTLADLAIELEAQLAEPTTPNRPAVRDALVKIYTRARDTTGAVTILRQWAKDEPERRIEALQQLARVHVSAEEFRNHERVLQELLDADPAGELDYRQQLAMSALERGRPEDARRHIRGLLGKPGTPDTVALEFSAGIYTLAALHEESVRLYRRALALHPERVETFLLLGNALRAAGRRDAAIGVFQELLLRQLPDDLFVVAVDGLLNMEAGAPVLAAAARAVRVRLAARPEQVFLHRVLQDLLEAQGDEPGRLAALEDTVVAAGEQRTNFVRELLQEAETRRDWRAYAAHGRTLLMLGDEVPPAVYLALGEALLHVEDLDGAARAFARARLGTDFAAVEARTAELYENAGRLAEAERIRVRLLRRAPDDLTLAMAVARLAERQGAVARALPQWVAAATRLLPGELQAGAGVARRPAVVRTTRAPAAVPFAEPFAGVLRCARSTAEFAALRDAIVAASATAAPNQRLAALRLLRHLARAYPEPDLLAALQAGEDALLAGGDETARREIRARRLRAGDFAGARAVPGDGETTAEELTLLVVAGTPAELAAAVARAPARLLPALARRLLAAGRRDEATALLAVAEAAPANERAAAVEELRRLFGLAAPVDDAAARTRLTQALQRSGALVAKVNVVFATLRDLPNLPASERAAAIAQLAGEVITAKDASAAERLLAQASDDLGADAGAQLVEIAFATVERSFQIGTRARALHFVPTERGVELVRTALRRFRDEERRTTLLQLLGNAAVPEAVQLALVPDCDPRGLVGTDRLVFTNGLERARPSPRVLAALADRFTQLLPGDAVTELLRVRTAGDAAAQRTAAVAALRTIGSRRLGERDEVVVGHLARTVLPADALTLLQELPANAPLELRVPLAVRSGDKAAAGVALLAAHEAKPDDTTRLYAAANFFEAEGRFEQAAALYRKVKSSSPVFYPHQALQLARLELQAGNALGALDALRAARDPAQTNFRLLLRALAEVDDAALRRSVLADALQQRAARGASAGLAAGLIRAIAGSGASSDRLSAVLTSVRLPTLAPTSAAEAEAAPSDYDLLAFLPEGEAVALALLRTLDDSARDADLGLYRGWLGAAARHGDAGPAIASAVATLQRAPFDAEARRIVLAAAQVGLPVPRAALLPVLQQVADDPDTPAATVGSLIELAANAGEPALGERILQRLLSDRAAFADTELRPFVPGLFALACTRLPQLVADAATTGELDSDVTAELLAAIVLHHPDAAAVLTAMQAAAGPGKDLAAAFGGGRAGAELLPQCGAALVLGDPAAAIARLGDPNSYWTAARTVVPQRLAAAVPPLERWRRPEQAGAFADELLALVATSEPDRAGVLARVAAVLAARLQAAGREREASELRQRVRGATAALAWRTDDWLPND
jgi:hypothetical protein